MNTRLDKWGEERRMNEMQNPGAGHGKSRLRSLSMEVKKVLSITLFNIMKERC